MAKLQVRYEQMCLWFPRPLHTSVFIIYLVYSCSFNLLGVPAMGEVGNDTVLIPRLLSYILNKALSKHLSNQLQMITIVGWKCLTMCHTWKQPTASLSEQNQKWQHWVRSTQYYHFKFCARNDSRQLSSPISPYCPAKQQQGQQAEDGKSTTYL